jgi:hypothetical protein
MAAGAVKRSGSLCAQERRILAVSALAIGR